MMSACTSPVLKVIGLAIALTFGAFAHAADQMEVVMVHGADTLTQPKGMLLLTAQAGALSYLAKQLGTQASEGLTKSAEFTALLGAVNQSVANLEAALLNQDAAAIKEAMGKLKGPYSKMFAKFG